MNINPKKLRFYRTENYFLIKAKCLSSGKWAVIGQCHHLAKQEILNGKTELIIWINQ